MKKIATLVLGASLVAGMASTVSADWDDPQQPFVLYGNTHYVGPRGLSSVLITSPDGHILIDGGSPKSPGQIARNIAELGFKLSDVKYILNSHEHFDHAGGISEMQRLSGAVVLSSVAGEPVLRTGLTDKGDPQFTDLPPSMQASANTRAVRDGEVVKLGALAVTAHYTPGHARGGTSWTWQSTEEGLTANVVYADSLTALAAKPFRYSSNDSYPTARSDLEQSISKIAALPCDILITAHPEAGKLWDRKASRVRLGNKAFIHGAGCIDYAETARSKLRATLAAELAETPKAADSSTGK